MFFQFGYFPHGSDGKESACNAGDSGSIPGWGRSHGGGKGNPLHYSLHGKYHEERGLWGYSPMLLQRVKHDLGTKQQQQQKSYINRFIEYT